MKNNILCLCVCVCALILFSCFSGANNGVSDVSDDPLLLLHNQLFFMKDSLRRLSDVGDEKKKRKLLVRMEILAQGIQESTKKIEALAKESIESHANKNEMLNEFFRDFSSREIKKGVAAIMDSSELSLKDRCQGLVDLISSTLPDERKLAAYRQSLHPEPVYSDQPWPGNAVYDRMMQDASSR